MIYLVLLLGLILRLVNLNQSFWLDEAAQVIESSRPFSQQLDINSDFHPPLFHLLLHFWMYLGSSEVIVRILSVILGLTSIYFFYKLVKEIFSDKIALPASFLLAINPYHIWYSQESRPYMLLIFTILLSTYFLVKKNFVAYALSLAAAFYSVYTAFLILPAHIALILVKDKKSLNKWFISLGSVMLIFLPWLPTFYRQLQIGFGSALQGWTDVVSVSALKLIPLSLAKFIFGRGSIDNNLLYGSVILPEISIFIYGCFVVYQDKKLWVWLAVFGLPLILAQLIAFIVPVMAPQRLIFLLPYFLILVVVGWNKLKGTLYYLALLITIAINLAGLAQYYFSPYVQREQWRQAVNFVENNSRGNSLVVFTFSDAFAPWLWYSRGSVDYLAVAPDFKINEDLLNNNSWRIRNSEAIYYFHYLTDLIDPNGRVENFIKALGFVETSKHDFPGVGFVSVYEKVLAMD